MSTESIDGFARIGERVARAIADHPADSIPKRSETEPQATTEAPTRTPREEHDSIPAYAGSGRTAASNWKAFRAPLIAVSVIVFFVVISNFKNGAKEQPTGPVDANVPAASPSTAVPPFQQQAATSSKPWEDTSSPAAVDDFKEDMPLNPGQTYTQDQLRYCKFERVRLEQIRKLVAETSKYQVNQFNTAIDQYNTLCGSFRYRESDLAFVEAQVARRTPTLIQEAGARFANWKRLEDAARGSGPTYPYGAGSQPTRDTIDPSTAQPAQAPRLSSCLGQSIVINFYREDDRQEAMRVARLASSAGIIVTDVENVVASAEARGSKSPYRWKRPAVVMHEPLSQSECAAALLTASGLTNGVARPLPKNFTGTPGKMEVWLPAPAGTLAEAR
ncbi:hypothetical protein Q3O97_16605 [Ralstonia pseudosolanacearum]|uniref:hypothetical protein n=1 Tax=Ralstonia pseudosolanacearum TaxID=1310165 RepID=UPI0026FE1F0E|nr:hypothetical protein [Ralstonia pseudosolanacearum]MDO3617471.1 hypothetical protein [Ralstonia pseudosolanacearum]